MEARPHPNSNDLKALRGIVSSWQDSLAGLDEADNDQTIAGHMVGAVLETDYDPERLTELDPQLMDVFDAVTQLETPLPTEAERSRLWSEVREQVTQLGETYLEPDPA
jgi:hypothetical protein